jgi:hypothetical protein
MQSQQLLPHANLHPHPRTGFAPCKSDQPCTTIAGTQAATHHISKLRGVKAHPMTQVPEKEFSLACESLNQIIALCQ